MHLSLVSLAGCVLCVHGGETVKNVGYIMQGYNAYYGNPSSTHVGVDPGLNTYAGEKIFEESYKDDRTTADGRYLVPDGFDLIPNVGCTIDFESTSEYKSSDYTKSLERKASFSAGGFNASFSASSDYKTFHEQTANQQRRLITSTAECVSFTLLRREYRQPNFTDNWRQGIATLNATYQVDVQETYFDFFDAFGTHVMTEQKLGSRFGFTSFFSQQAWSTVAQSGVDVKIAAGYEGVVKAGGSVEPGAQHNAQKAFDSNATSIQMITLGKQPVGDDPVQWATQVNTEPMPISFILDSICNLFADHDERKIYCKNALRDSEYCTKRLMKRGAVDSCQPDIFEPVCVWNMDCEGTNVCVENKCYETKPLHQYWRGGGLFTPAINSYKWHFPPAIWPEEDRTGRTSEPFYVFECEHAPQNTLPVYQYFHAAALGGSHWSIHFHPAWTKEHDETRIFCAFDKPVANAQPVHQYWHNHQHYFNFHFPPALDGEQDQTSWYGKPFYAFKLSDLGAWDERDGPLAVSTEVV